MTQRIIVPKKNGELPLVILLYARHEDKPIPQGGIEIHPAIEVEMYLPGEQLPVRHRCVILEKFPVADDNTAAMINARYARDDSKCNTPYFEEVCIQIEDTEPPS